MFFYSGHQIKVESHIRPEGVLMWPDVFGDYLATTSHGPVEYCTIIKGLVSTSVESGLRVCTHTIKNLLPNIQPLAEVRPLGLR